MSAGTTCAPLSLPRRAFRHSIVALSLPALLLAAALTACSGTGGVRSLALTMPVPPEVTFDLARLRELGDEQAARQLARTRVLFLGEHHAEPRSQAYQRQVLEQLAATGRPLVVALEYFSPAADAALEDWRQGRLDELEFLERSGWYEHWGFPWTRYRDLFALFRARRIALHGVNATRAERDAARAGHMEELGADVRALLSDLDEPLPPHDAYLLDALRRAGHADDLQPDSPGFQRFRRVQGLWDRLMGVRTARLAEALPPDGIAVLLAGSGHVAHGLGADLQAARAVDLPQLSVWDAVVPATELDAAGRFPVPRDIADWVRVYVRQADEPDVPALSGVRLDEPDAPNEAASGAESGAGSPAPPAPRGIRVRGVSPLAAAELRVLRAGDVLLRLNGTAPRSVAALRLAYEQLAPGTPARVNLWRDGKELDLDLTPRRGGSH